MKNPMAQVHNNNHIKKVVTFQRNWIQEPRHSEKKKGKKATAIVACVGF